MQHRRKFIIPLLVLLFSGCQGLLQVKPEMEISGYPTETVNAEGGTYRFTIKTTHSWTATVSDPWIELDCTSGDAGTAELTLLIFSNDYHEERSSEIQFFCEDLSEVISIRQKQDDYMELTTDNATFDSDGGELVIDAMANFDYEIIIEDGAKDWIVPQTTRSLNSESHHFLVYANTATSGREGKIYLKGAQQERTFTVSQSAFVPRINIKQTKYHLASYDHSLRIEVDSNCEIHVHCFSDWIHELGSHDGFYDFHIHHNDECKDREDIITFTSTEHDLKVMVYVFQEGDRPYINILHADFNLPATENTFKVNVDSNVEIEILLEDYWIELIDQKNNYQYTFKVQENNTEYDRITRIRFINNEYNITEWLTVRQEYIKQFTPSQEVYTTDYLSKKMTIDYHSTSSFNVRTNVEWIEINNSIVRGNGKLYLSLQENKENSAREAVIEVYDTEHRFQFSVIQNGKTSNGGDIDDMEHIEW